MSKEKIEKEKQPGKGIKFYAAILHASGDFGVEAFDALEQLVSRLKTLIDQDVSVFSFSGQMLPVSKPPFRHLLTPWGPKPLFDVQAEDLEIDDTGYLGIDPIHLSDAPQLRSPNGGKDFSDSSDEFFDDSDEPGVGVFDNVLPDPDS
jgi:hypothetical protein